VAAEGYGPLSYLWHYNGTVIAGATSSTYSISNVQARQAGTYSVEVANAAGSVPSDDALLAVALDPGNVIAWGTTLTVSPPFLQLVRVHRHADLQYFWQHRTYGNHLWVIGGASQWIKFIPPVSGALFLNTDGSSYDTSWRFFRPSSTNPAVLVSLPATTTVAPMASPAR